MAHDLRLEHEQQQAQPDEQQPGDVQGKAPEPDEREDQAERADEPRQEVRVDELDDQPEPAEHEQQERDVRVGQQVEEPLAAGSSAPR